MSTFVAALPMYDWPEVRDEVDAWWGRLRALLRESGIDAPEHLTRRNCDLPAVRGGVRDWAGRAAIAPSPATLQPDELDLPTLWRHPALLVANTCWGPMEAGLQPHVRVVGQTSYDGVDGGKGETYSSAIVMRKGAAPVSGDTRPLVDGAPLVPVGLLRGKRLAFNTPDSMSGVIALRRNLVHLEAIRNEGEFHGFWSSLVETGGHRLSVRAVAEGRADVAAIDCRSWALARRFEPAAKDLLVVGWTGRRRGLPLISAAGTPDDVLVALRSALAASQPSSRSSSG